MTSASRRSHLSNSLSSVTRGKLVRCVNSVARTSRTHNCSNGIAYDTNIVCYASMQVAEQQERHHVLRDV
jgi:hypothetical protein